MSSYDKYTSSSVSTSNVRTVSPMRVNTSLYKEPETDYCRRCAKYIYPLEMMGPVMGFKYHKLCFRCHICERQLDFKNYRTNVIDLNDRELYCSAHNPRNGAFNENVYGYNARSGATGANDMQVNEYSSEYYKTQQHKSNENLDSVGRSRSPYGGYVGNLSRLDYAAAHGGAPVGYVAEPGLTIPANPVGWKSEKYSKSSEQLNHASSSSSMTMMQSHHRHEYSSSSSSTTGGNITTVPASPAAYNIGVPITNPSGTYYVNTPTSPTSNVHILPTTLNNDRYTYEQYDNHNASSNNTSGIRNIVVDVISHRDESDSDDNHNNIDRRAPYYNNQNYSSSEQRHDTAIPSAGASYGGGSQSSASSGGASSFHQYSSTSTNVVDNYNLRAIISEAMLHDKQHRPTSLYYSQQPQQVPAAAVQPTEYYRNPSYERQASSSSSNSNLKKIYAEASMTAAIRSPTTPKTSVDFPSPSTPTSNLKNIYSEALNQHNQQQQQQQQQQHRVASSSSSSNVNYFEGKDSNLKRIFAEASESAAHPAPPHHQRVVMSTDSSDNRLNNIKHIVNEAAITNSLADKIAASTQVYAGPSQASYSTSYVPPPQPQTTTVIPGQVISEHRQEYSSSSSSAVKQVIAGGETVHHHQHQQHHSQFYEASSSSTSSIGGGSPMISRPPINNQITLPTDSGVDRKSNLVNIMSDVIATNNSAYTAYPNRFQFTGPNANLKGIVAEAADYNARIAPSNQNMYHNLRDAPLSTGDINPNSIIGDNKGFGIARLTVHYDQLRSRLSVTVHEARNLKNLDKKSISDPYARVYLKPDGKPSYKRKTRIVKNNLNPVWQETFDYSMTLNEALEKVLTVNLKDERGFFEKQEGQFLGEVVIPLGSVRNLTQPFTKWFFLQPLNSNSILANTNATTGGHVSSF